MCHGVCRPTLIIFPQIEVNPKRVVSDFLSVVRYDCGVISVSWLIYRDVRCIVLLQNWARRCLNTNDSLFPYIVAFGKGPDEQSNVTWLVSESVHSAFANT